MSERANILGVGMACALGPNFATCVEAYAEGAQGFRRVASLVGVDGMPIALGEVIGYEEERDYPRRLARLAELALEDLLGAQVCPEIWLMLPAWAETSPVAADIRSAVGAVGRRFARSGRIRFGGRAEALRFIADAARDIAGGSDPIVVGAVDSLLQAELLDIAALQGRLFSAQNPYGGYASEAACVLLLDGEAVSDGPAAAGAVLGAFSGREAEPVEAPKGLIGRGLADAFVKAARHVRPGRLIADLSGERWRAEEFGFACSAAGPAIAALAGDVEAPALYVGDCGAAMGALLPALALMDPPARGHPRRGPLALLSASSRDSGARAVMILERTMRERSDSHAGNHQDQ